MLKRLTLPGFLLAAALAFIAAPDSQLSAATCGGPGEQLCKENMSCASILFFWQCTTRFDYWDTEEESPTEPEPEPDPTVP